MGAGSKVRPQLAERQAGRRRPGRRWEQVWGWGERGKGETRGPGRLTRPGDSQEAGPGSRRRPKKTGRGAGEGEGKDWVHAELSSHLPPPGSALAGTPRPVPPSWPRPLSGSLPGHTASARPRRLRVPQQPTAEHARSASCRTGAADGTRVPCLCSSRQRFPSTSNFGETSLPSSSP